MPTNTLRAEFKHLDALMDSVRGGKPRTVAVVQPVSAFALGAAIDAAREGLIAPILVGERRRIEATAAGEGIALGGIPIVDASSDAAAATAAVAIVRGGDA